MTKQTIITTIIIALIFFVIGFAFASYYKSSDNTYQAGWDAAKQRLMESGFTPIMEDMEIISVNGTVQEVKDNKIYLKIQPLTSLADPDLDNRIIETDEHTKIYQLVEKDQEQLQREMDEFQQKMQEQTNNLEVFSEPIMPPELFIKQEISLDKIQTDQQITVMAEQDIKETKQFKAVEIVIQFIPMPMVEAQEINVPVVPLLPASTDIPSPADAPPIEEMN